MKIDRDRLRREYDAVISEIDRSRGKHQLANTFYSKIGDAVFDACCLALTDFAESTPETHRLHVVSAQWGPVRPHSAKRS